MHKWLPIKNSFVCIQIKLLFNYQLKNEVSWANFNTYKRIFNWQPFMHRVKHPYLPITTTNSIPWSLSFVLNWLLWRGLTLIC